MDRNKDCLVSSLGQLLLDCLCGFSQFRGPVVVFLGIGIDFGV